MKKLKSSNCILLFVTMISFAYSTNTYSAKVKNQAEPRSYLELPSSGRLPTTPYVWERRSHEKHIVVIGSRHTRDTHSSMLGRIEAIFKRVRPEVVIHESVAPDPLKLMPRDQAIKIGADLGFAVYLAGQYGAQIRSGDAPEKAEFAALLTQYPAEDVFVFLVGQRLIGSVRKPDLQIARAEYSSFYQNYLVQNGIPQRPAWEQWEGFLIAYRHVVGKPFSRDSWSPAFTNPTLKSGRLNQIARTSNVVRDRYLLAAIKKALNDYDRVIVVFGGWHVLALEPMLDDMRLE